MLHKIIFSICVWVYYETLMNFVFELGHIPKILKPKALMGPHVLDKGYSIVFSGFPFLFVCLFFVFT